VPDLEERVAALEEAMSAPSLSASAPWTEAEQADFLVRYTEAIKQPPLILPLVPPLTPEQIRCLLRECVTVVKPGETLVVRVGFDLRPEQVRELQEVADALYSHRDFPFKVLVFPGEELAIAEPGGVPGAA
jgi:hypothetical protein